jgi:phosphoglycolate phosphatase-like HAD superfamily hydrolase
MTRGADDRGTRAIDAAVFDLDGTLADTFGLLLAAFDAATRPVRGRALTHAEMVAHFGPGAGTEAAIVAALTGREEADDLARFYEIYAGRHGGLVRLFPGLREALAEG